MITNNYNSKDVKKRDTILLLSIVLVVIVAIWLFTPPGDKVSQISLWSNNTKLFFAKLVHGSEANEWKVHRNNAVYLAKVNKKAKALAEMNLAIQMFPAYMSDKQLQSLYKDSATLKMFYEDYNGALSDYLKAGNYSIVDKFRIAMLLCQKERYPEALRYCNEIVNMDNTAYSGYACLAEVYSSAGRGDVAVRVFDLLIDKQPNKARYYADRALYKRRMADMSGYEEDIAKAKSLNSAIVEDDNMAKTILEPKVLQLDAKK